MSTSWEKWKNDGNRARTLQGMEPSGAEGGFSGAIDSSSFGSRKAGQEEVEREEEKTVVVYGRCVNPLSNGDCEEFCPVKVLGDFGFPCGCSCGGPGVSLVCGSAESFGGRGPFLSPKA